MVMSGFFPIPYGVVTPILGVDFKFLPAIRVRGVFWV